MIKSQQDLRLILAKGKNYCEKQTSKIIIIAENLFILVNFRPYVITLKNFFIEIQKYPLGNIWKSLDNCRESMNSLENIRGSENCSQFSWFWLPSEMASEWHLRIKKINDI